MISKSNWRLRVSKISPRTHTHTPLLLIIQHPKSKPVQTFSRNQQTAFTLVWKHHLAMRWFLLIVITPDQLGLDRDPSPILRAASQPGPAWVPLLQGKGKKLTKPCGISNLIVLAVSLSFSHQCQKRNIKSIHANPYYFSYMFMITLVAFLGCLLDVGNILCHICSSTCSISFAISPHHTDLQHRY